MRILATNGDWDPDPPDKAAHGTGAYSVPVFLTLRDFAGRSQSTTSPNGFIPFSKTVFGNLPVPHKMKEPKSLYQSPSGATGPVRTHA